MLAVVVVEDLEVVLLLAADVDFVLVEAAPPLLEPPERTTARTTTMTAARSPAAMSVERREDRGLSAPAPAGRPSDLSRGVGAAAAPGAAA